MFNGGGLSVADVAAVMGNRNNDNGWGGDGGWWAWIILLCLFGWGGEGNGLFGNRGGSNATTTAIDASLQRGFDTQSIISKLDGITNGICNLGYDQLAQMNGITNTIMQGNFGLQQAINAASVADMQQNNALTAQIQQCCCNLERGQADANYQRAADTCAITTAIANAAQQIMQNDNCNYRQLHDEQVALQMQAKDAEITRLTAALQKCDLQSSQLAQTQDIVNQIRPTANPAFIVPNPFTGYGWGWNGYNNGGCCGNTFANACC